jgi:hypothetical protein
MRPPKNSLLLFDDGKYWPDSQQADDARVGEQKSQSCRRSIFARDKELRLP